MYEEKRAVFASRNPALIVGVLAFIPLALGMWVLIERTEEKRWKHRRQHEARVLEVSFIIYFAALVIMFYEGQNLTRHVTRPVVTP